MLFVCFIIFFIFATLLSLYFAFMVDGPAPVVVAIFIFVFYFVIFRRVVFYGVPDDHDIWEFVSACVSELF